MTGAVYRRRRFAVFGGAVLVLALGLYLPVTLLAPLGPASASAVAYAAPQSPAPVLAWPGTGASAVGAVGYPGVLAASGSTDPLPMASISKVVTALVVLEAKPLRAGEQGPTLTFSTADAALYGKYAAVRGKVAPMRAGSTLSELDVLRLSLVVSANNYAEALANWAFGSPAAFVDATRAWLLKNHLDHTVLVEPTGIDPANVSTASDLVALGKIALADPIVEPTVRLASVSYPGIGTFENTNKLLGVDGIDGIKTGTLDSAGAMLLFAADYVVAGQAITIIGAVLGGVDHDSLDVAVSRLLDSVQAGFQEIPLAKAGETFGKYSSPWSRTAYAVSGIGATAVTWAGTQVTARMRTSEVHSARSGAGVGSVTFTVGEQQVEVPLLLDRAVSDPGPWWRLTHPFEAIGLAR